MCHRAHVIIRRQLCEVSSLLSLHLVLLLELRSSGLHHKHLYWQAHLAGPVLFFMTESC